MLPSLVAENLTRRVKDTAESADPKEIETELESHPIPYGYCQNYDIYEEETIEREGRTMEPNAVFLDRQFPHCYAV